MFDLISLIVKGGVVMIPLLLCSVISLAVTIERILFWRRIRSKEPIKQMLQSVEQGKINEAVSRGQESSLPTARVLASGLAHRNPSFSKAMEVAAQAEVPILKRRLVILDTIITLAPLLGLLGTITGMISSFGRPMSPENRIDVDASLISTNADPRICPEGEKRSVRCLSSGTSRPKATGVNARNARFPSSSV